MMSFRVPTKLFESIESLVDSVLSWEGEEELAPEPFGIRATPGEGVAVCVGPGETVGIVEDVCVTAALSGSRKLIAAS
jgi:hypothetical protein